MAEAATNQNPDANKTESPAGPAPSTGPANAGATAGAAGAAGAVADGGITAEDNAIHSLDFFLDISLRVSVELGRTKILIRDLLQLGQGSVLELSKFAGEPLEMLVNDKLIARGEVVVVNEKRSEE